MYTDADFSGAKTSLNRFIALYALLAALLLGLFAYSLVERIVWLAYAAAAAFVLATLFLWGNFGGRLVAWRRFLRDMRAGLEREVTGVIASIDGQEALKEGLEFRALRLFTGEESDKAGGRLLYVDSSRFPLPAGPGQKVRCRLFGNYVKGISMLEGE
jgi:hypothetical protein